MHNGKHPAGEAFLLHLGDAIRDCRINLFLSQEQLGSRAHLHNYGDDYSVWFNFFTVKLVK
jgi:hypothetical protein